MAPGLHEGEKSRLSSHSESSHSAAQSAATTGTMPGTSSADVPHPDTGLFMPIHSPHFYPGIYCRSGFNIMKVMHRIITRPHPRVHLGAVDASCAVILCDLHQPDTPIVYASDSFLWLTGYTRDEVIGRNARFLQTPPPTTATVADDRRLLQRHSGTTVDSATREAMRQAVLQTVDVQVRVINFRKDGTAFVNLLTMIPILWSDNDDSQQPHSDVGHVTSSLPPESRSQATYRYCVGFLCNLGAVP